MHLGARHPDMAQDYTFTIAGSYSPDDIPLERLGEYLTALGALFGERANVHFGGLQQGSTMVHARVDHVAAPKVANRIRAVATGDMDDQLRKAARSIDTLLYEDNATGDLKGGGDNVIHVDFPGRNRPQAITYGPTKQAGAIDGVVVRIEGRDATVHVGIVDGERRYSLEAPAAMGRKLALLFHSGPVRFHGVGTWFRLPEGKWELRKFTIDRVEELDDGPLSAAVDAIRALGPSGWSKLPDAHGEVLSERGSEEARH